MTNPDIILKNSALQRRVDRRDGDCYHRTPTQGKFHDSIWILWFPALFMKEQWISESESLSSKLSFHSFRSFRSFYLLLSVRHIDQKPLIPEGKSLILEFLTFTIVDLSSFSQFYLLVLILSDFLVIGNRKIQQLLPRNLQQPSSHAKVHVIFRLLFPSELLYHRSFWTMFHQPIVTKGRW